MRTIWRGLRLGLCWGLSASELWRRSPRAPSSIAAAARLGSSAEAAHPGSSEPASMIRIPREGSRGGRSPHADRVCQIWRSGTHHPLVQGALVLDVPASHSRLADGAGHDDEAGMVLGQHDGAVHDVEAPAQASNQHSCMGSAMLIAPHLLSTMKVSSKLATSSSSNPAVGKTVACHAIEPRSPHGRHGGRERRGPPAARLRAVLAKFFWEYSGMHMTPGPGTGSHSGCGACS